MAFKMKGYNYPGSSPMKQNGDKDLEYRDPAEFSGPGGYIKHTGKWLGSKIKKGVKSIAKKHTDRQAKKKIHNEKMKNDPFYNYRHTHGEDAHNRAMERYMKR